MNAFRHVRPVVLVILPVAFCLTLGCSKRQPTVQEETKAEKHKAVADSFTGNATDDGGEHAESLKRFFDECADKIDSGDPEQFGEVFDTRMAIRLLKQQKMLPKNIGDEAGMARVMEKMLAQRLANPVTGINFASYEIRRVTFIKKDVEAVAYVRHWDADDVVSKKRWWLIRDGDDWRAYDFEFFESSTRMSVMLGLGFKMADQDDPSAKRLPELMSAIQNGATGDVESAREVLQGLDGVSFPPVIESLRLVTLASFLIDEGEYEQALEKVERALAIHSDIPVIHLLKSVCYNGLLQHEKALKSAAFYAKLLGKDGEYFVEVGDAYAGLGMKEKAIEAYHSGLADDPQAGYNVLGLMKILSADQRDVVIEYYKALSNPDVWFVGFSEILLQNDDAETLRAVIEIHQTVMPDDENLPVYEKVLAELVETD